MAKEFRTYLFLIIVLVFFWINGSIVDSALWGHTSYNAPAWVIRNLSIFWLVCSQALAPFLIVLILKPKWNTLLAFMVAGFWGSMLWDMFYGLLTRGTIFFDIPRWFNLGDFGGVIGFTSSQLMVFHFVRFLLGLGVLILLYHRTKKIPS